MIFLGSVDPYGLKEPSEMEDNLEKDSETALDNMDHKWNMTWEESRTVKILTYVEENLCNKGSLQQ